MDHDSSRSAFDEEDESREFDDGLDENLMGDEEDRRRLAQMTEKEREQELFNRSEKRESAKIRFEIERKLRLKAKKREHEKRQSARKRLKASEIYSSDDSSSEESDIDYTPEANNVSAPRIASSSSSSSPSLESSESERENDDLEASEDGQTIQDNFQMTLADLKALQLKRDKIEKWVYSPFFKETAIGLFVKISVSNHPTKTLQHVYKVAQIVDITKGTMTYALSDDGINKTDQQCLVRIGGVDRTYKMSFVSNRSFDEDDYISWKDQTNLAGQDTPSREYFNKKKRDLHRAINYVYKDEDIAYEINERKRFKDYPNNFALRKTELMGEKADADAAGDYDRSRRIQQEIMNLDQEAKNLEKTRSSSTFSAISFVNERNRMRNIEESERVLKESKSVKTEDPFTRRKCAPTIIHNRNNGDTLNKQIKDSLSQSTNPSSTDEVQGKSVDDLFRAHAGIDLDLDLDI